MSGAGLRDYVLRLSIAASDYQAALPVAVGQQLAQPMRVDAVAVVRRPGAEAAAVKSIEAAGQRPKLEAAAAAWTAVFGSGWSAKRAFSAWHKKNDERMRRLATGNLARMKKLAKVKADREAAWAEAAAQEVVVAEAQKAAVEAVWAAAETASWAWAEEWKAAAKANEVSRQLQAELSA